jgi:predicted PurR-regulated permease PerM
LITGGELMGIPGLLIAVPVVAGSIRVLIMNFRPPKPITAAEAQLGLTNALREATDPGSIT